MAQPIGKQAKSAVRMRSQSRVISVVHAEVMPPDRATLDESVMTARFAASRF